MRLSRRRGGLRRLVDLILWIEFSCWRGVFGNFFEIEVILFGVTLFIEMSWVDEIFWPAFRHPIDRISALHVHGIRDR
jgi:hypothetical protein